MRRDVSTLKNTRFWASAYGVVKEFSTKCREKDGGKVSQGRSGRFLF